MISIPDELALRLKEEPNASALITRLLTEYYEMERNRQLTPEDIEKKIRVLEAKLEYEKKLEEFESEIKNK